MDGITRPEPGSVAGACMIRVSPEIVMRHLMDMLRERIGNETYALLDTTRFLVLCNDATDGAILYTLGYAEIDE